MSAARASTLVFVVALLVAVAGARPYAGSWNDGSRLAAVESLLERGTLAIDDSVFVRPADATARGRSPYAPDDSNLQHSGTQDKLFIRGHYHSDKPPVISVLMAALYAPGYWLGVLPSPGERPERFAWIMTLLTSVAAYAVALGCMMRLGRVVGLRGWTQTLWFAAFALATFALAYTRHVNNHILQLAVVAGWCLLSAQLASGVGSRLQLLALGLLLGFGYNLDLASGPLLFAAGVALVVLRTRQLLPALLVCLAAAPGVVACHATNLALGGVLGPINAVPDYFRWPGSPFGTGNMTGVMRHSPYNLTVYALALLFGKHGILVHNLPLLLALPAAPVVLRRASTYRLEVMVALLWCGATWAAYALMSNNYGGGCCSVRWFVPFLAPGFFVLAVYLEMCPRRVWELLVLTSGGAVLSGIMWAVGPWTLRMVPGLWPIAGVTLVGWFVVRFCRPKPRVVKHEAFGAAGWVS